MTTHVPDRTPDAAVGEVRAREAAHTRELAAQGHVLRLWRPPLAPGEWRTLGLFAAASRDELEQVLSSMPLRVWRSDEVQDLAPHPNDPAAPGSRPRPPLARDHGHRTPDQAGHRMPGPGIQNELARVRPGRDRHGRVRTWTLWKSFRDKSWS
jgi:muconolactone delta-isomerase